VKLGLALNELERYTAGKLMQVAELVMSIDEVAYDTRKIRVAPQTVFFALNGMFRDGHDFIGTAYDMGARCFVVSKPLDYSYFPGAAFIYVPETLRALQNLAKNHREKMTCPVVVISGSAGKTMVKEWLYHFIAPEKRVVRSPKSFNSQLGVALSLLEIRRDTEIALIEAGISQPGEMDHLHAMIQPNFGVFTSFGRAHAENFLTIQDHFNEKLDAFKGVERLFVSSTIDHALFSTDTTPCEFVDPNAFSEIVAHAPFQDRVSILNASLALSVAKNMIKAPDSYWIERIKSLPKLALRLEVFEGVNGITIINDTYNLDFDALIHSLDFQREIAGDRQRVVVIGIDALHQSAGQLSSIQELINLYQPISFHVRRDPHESIEFTPNAVVLFKGTRNAEMERLAQQFRLKRHQTQVEIDLGALRDNLATFKSLLDPKTKIMAMVKAQSYGSGIVEIASFLQRQGIHYLGVAYADEGVELRKQGITVPILVMNAEEAGFEACIAHQLEPAIFAFDQLDAFIKEAILQGVTAYPIHIKLDSGMKRLGFEPEDATQVLQIIQSQPEVHVKSIYTHLADADNRRDKRFTSLQVQRFMVFTTEFAEGLAYSFDRHVLNSDGIANYAAAQFEQVRIGIGMYGVSSHPNLKRSLRPVLSWSSTVSQVKHVNKGESVGYGRTFRAKDAHVLAVIPVGYADGFARCLSNGKGGVFIKNTFCPTVGRVCMDMIMVDVTGLEVKAGERVEIIGKQQTLEDLALAMDTIPYEVMTGIADRVHRIYIES